MNEIDTRSRQAPRAVWSWLGMVALAAYALALSLTVTGSSLWTDEAFSAYLASHRTAAGFWQTLANGDSSDLQMMGYYCYLFAWARIFGESEIALRSANVPFIVLFATAIGWISRRVFRSPWVWLIPASCPFVWRYASEARAYMAVLALATVACGGVLGHLIGTELKQRSGACWAVAGSLLLGTWFHMLMLLEVGPLLVLVIVWHRLARTPQYPLSQTLLKDWLRPVVILGPFGLGLLAFLAFTFLRGTNYQYPRPSLLASTGIVSDVLGLSTFGPNRTFSVDLRPYWPWLLAGWTLFFAGAAALAYGMWRHRKAIILALGAATLLGYGQVFVIETTAGLQWQVRHTAALMPLLLCWIMAAAKECGEPRRSLAVALPFGLVWTVASLRLALPENRREDIRDAVSTVRRLAQQDGNDIAIVTDPVGVAYYHLRVEGAAPCFPLLDSCKSGFEKTDWRKQGGTVYANLWKSPQIKDWLNQRARAGKPVLVLASLQRVYRESDWWPVLREQGQPIKGAPHGFAIYRMAPRVPD